MTRELSRCEEGLSLLGIYLQRQTITESVNGKCGSGDAARKLHSGALSLPELKNGPSLIHMPLHNMAGIPFSFQDHSHMPRNCCGICRQQ
eukprot:6225528-Amphidinium_carterae.2